jgi:glycosyltransferase involved in cell wall biosynthesis
MVAVSIFLPTHARNKSGLLARSISSVLANTFADFELFVVDDGSEDGSADTIKEFARHDTRVKHVRFDKNVALPALTTGLAAEQATGEYVAWQFDDSVWRSNLLETLVGELRSHPKVSFAPGAVEVHSPVGIQRLGRPLDRALLLEGHNHLANNATLGRRAAYNTLGWFDPHLLLKRNCDWDFWTRASETHQFSYIDAVVAEEHGPSLSTSLGNSVTGYLALTRRYARLQRNEQLAIDALQAFDPFRIPDQMEMTDEDWRKFAFLIVEHFCSTGDLGSASAKISRLPLIPAEIKSLEAAAICRFALVMKSDAHREAVSGLEKYIQDQSNYIAEQAAIIRQQEEFIKRSRWQRLARVLERFGLFRDRIT